ncbi:hypothetical protein LTS10_006959 [Elasticomyces elasticus]|nr:hypothetical protein LTS10_006959 [Elasticomyces elasticus]
MASSPTFLGLKGQTLVYAVVLCSSFGFLLCLTTSPEFLDQFGNPNASLLGFLVSSYEVGAMIGAIAVFLSGDRFGRKPINIAGAAIVAIGAAIQTSSFGVGQFLAGRLIAGFGLGMMTTVIPIWLAECAMPKNRGRMMAMQLSNLIMGLIIAIGLTTACLSMLDRFSGAFLALCRLLSVLSSVALCLGFLSLPAIWRMSGRSERRLSTLLRCEGIILTRSLWP